MRGSRRASALVAMLAAGAVAVAGCSSSTKASTHDNTTGSSDSATVATGNGASGIAEVANLAAMVPSSIKSAHVLTVGATLQSPPAFSYESDGKTPTGYEYELSQAIAKTLGLTLKVSDMSFSQLINSVRTGRVDFIMSKVSDTATREKEIDFVDYAISGLGLLVAKGNPKHITTASSLCGLTVADSPGTNEVQWLQSVSDTCTSAGKSKVSTFESTDQSAQLNALLTGRVQAVMTDTQGGPYHAKIIRGGTALEMAPLAPIEPGNLGMGFSKSNSALRDAVQAALQHLMDDGVYKDILARYNLSNTAIPKATVNQPAPPAGS